MTGMALLATIIIAALTGTLTAYLTEAMREASRTMTADLAAIGVQIDTERVQRHRTGTHVRRGGRGDCLLCGAHDPYDVAQDGL